MTIDTIPQQFLDVVETFDKKAAFRHKKDGRFVDVSHRETLERVHQAALGLRALGLTKQDRVGLLSENRLEWAIADLAILTAGGITVPVYPSLPVNQVEYLLQDSGARAIFVSTADQARRVAECRAHAPALQHVFAFDPHCRGEGVMTLEDVAALGAKVENMPTYRELISTIGREDCASIIYTSGTTGEPKGAMLTHWNILTNVRDCLSVLRLGPEDTCLSFLPLSHALERTAGYYVMLTAGVTIAYAETVDTVAENMIEVSPTVMIAVPRFYEKIYARVLDTVERSSAVTQGLFRWAVRTGRKYVAEKTSGGASGRTRSKRALADALVFRKLKARTGGRIRFFVSGGAPIAREIIEFFHAAGVPILEGYGLTETSPVLSVNTFDDFKLGTVGKPLPHVEIRIAEDGEILARGDNVMQGYYRKPRDTSEAIVDGWFHTGDIGHLDEHGFLVITDRKKDVIVTAGGKNVAPQAIENQLKNSKYIDEVVLIGNRRKFISAVIVPDFENLLKSTVSQGLPTENPGELLRQPQVRELFAAEVDRLCQPFAPFERVKQFVLLDRPLSIASGELTPSLKVKRRIVEQKLIDQIDALYHS